MSETLLEFARGLEARDRVFAGEIEQVEELRRRAAAVGERADVIRRFLEELPELRTGLEHQIVHLERELTERELARDEAEAALAQADEEDRAMARRTAVRARDAAAVTTRELEQARTQLVKLDVEAKELLEELERLQRDAEELTRGIHEAPEISRGTVPEPGDSAEALIEWASRARAALLLARSALETQRERVVREANELAAAALGDAGATSVAGVVERLERAGR
jgi:chromosome segregation ATPase